MQLQNMPELNELSYDPLLALRYTPGLAVHYKLGKEIGRGGFGIVYEAESKLDGKKYAIKYSKDIQQHDGALLQELISIETIRQNPHKNILTPILSGIDLSTHEKFDITELCSNKSIEETKFTIDETLDIIYQVASGLNHLHGIGLTHRDVKVNNIFCHQENDEKIYKLADFTFSCAKKDMSSVNGNEYFLAPEMLQNDPYDNKIDIWGLGITLYYLIYCDVPFKGLNKGQIGNSINSFNWSNLKTIDKDAQKNSRIIGLLKGMLNKEPASRLSAKDVMLKINEIKENRFNQFGRVVALPNIKMSGSICSDGRGILKLNGSNDQKYYSLDSSGIVQIINEKRMDLNKSLNFDVGYSINNIWSSIALNMSENCLLVAGCNNKSVYATSPVDLVTTSKWEETHSSFLSRIVFLDNDNFCVGYNDGELKKFNIYSPREISTFNPYKSGITSFCVGDTLAELLVGDESGRLFSVNWKIFIKSNWNSIIHQKQINFIYKAESIFATSSCDESIVLLDSSNPPNTLSTISVGSNISQLLFTMHNLNIIALCDDKIILYKNNDGKIDKVSEKTNSTDFNNSCLSSAILFNSNTLIIGDMDGCLYSVNLIK